MYVFVCSPSVTSDRTTWKRSGKYLGVGIRLKAKLIKNKNKVFVLTYSMVPRDTCTKGKINGCNVELGKEPKTLLHKPIQ